MERDGRKEREGNGWGWVVCFGTIITFVAGIGHVSSFGLIYRDFMIETNSTAKALTMAHGTFAIMLAIGGIILNITSKLSSLRIGGFIGAIVMITGSFSTIFISNANQLPITFGVLQGIGFGMMVPVCYSTINYYFVQKRTTVMSICKAVQGIILMWYPQVLERMLTVYGFRGTLLLLSGISLHTLPGMIIMRTHKREPRNGKTAKKLKCKKEYEEDVDFLDKNCKNDDQATTHVDEKKSFKIRNELSKILNLKVLKDPAYCNICVGQSFVNFSDLTFFILQPMLLFQFGYDSMQVAACISTCAGADVAGRCVLAVISSLVHIDTRALFYLATLLTFLFRIVILQVQQFTWVLVLTVTLGVLRAWLHVASPLVISNQVAHQDFPGAYALFMLATGIVNVSCAPLIGLLRDFYQDYVPAFYALALCCVPCIVCWPIEYLFKHSLKCQK